MRVHFLGTTGYHPNEHRHTACIMLPEIGVILDAGTGIFRARKLIATEELAIFLTHAHLDHSIGLTFLFDILYQKTVRRTQVFGEPDKLQAVRQHLFSPLLFPALPPMTFCDLTSGQDISLRPGVIVRHFRLKHPGGTVGYRVDFENRSMAYVTDTTAALDADYLESIRGVDLLIHECYFRDGCEDRAKLTGHSCLRGGRSGAESPGETIGLGTSQSIGRRASRFDGSRRIVRKRDCPD